jgi:hypothetical protein
LTRASQFECWIRSDSLVGILRRRWSARQVRETVTRRVVANLSYRLGSRRKTILPETCFWTCQQRKLGIRWALPPRITFGLCGGQKSHSGTSSEAANTAVMSWVASDHSAPSANRRKLLANASNLLEAEQSRELCSRMTDAVKFRWVEPDRSAHLGVRSKIEVGLRTFFNGWHTPDRS